jgi:hypothetical protein
VLFHLEGHAFFINAAGGKSNAARGDAKRRTRGLPSPHAEIKSPHAAFFDAVKTFG